MKKAVLFVLILVLLLGACNSNVKGVSQADITEISERCSLFKEKQSYSASFRLNMTFSEESATLLFSQGEYGVSTEKDGVVLEGSMSQIYLGVPSAVTVEYENGVLTTVANESKSEENIDSKTLFGRIIYSKPFIPEESLIVSTERITSGDGSGCKLRLKDNADLFLPMLGEDIYKLAKIYDPKKNLTTVRNASITYIFGENGIAGMTFDFILSLYETPPYNPNGDKVNMSDYTLDISVNFTVKFK